MEQYPHRDLLHPIAELIGQYDRFVIAAHIRPDADAIGSTLTLGLALRQLGKQVTMINEDPVPEHLHFLTGVKDIVQPGDVTELNADIAVSVDNGSLKRLGDKTLQLLAYSNIPVCANIDHHRTNELFGTVNCVIPTECATGAVLYHLFRYMGLELSPAMRDALYVAISTDTGSFQYEMTSAEVMEMAADLIRQGVNVAQINRYLYQEQSWQKIQLMREALNGMALSSDGKICTLCMTNAIKRRIGCKAEDTEGLIDLLRSVKGVILAAYFEENEEDDKIRISLRSKSQYISVARLAQQFGGGGHDRAAGVHMPGPIEQAYQTMLSALQQAIQQEHE